MSTTQHRTVMEINEAESDEQGIQFVQSHDEGEIPELFYMDPNLWDSMGQPSVITLTVNIGDLLNNTLPEAGEALTASLVTGPHSRACGIAMHNHGTSCSDNCPTCGGKDKIKS